MTPGGRQYTPEECNAVLASCRGQIEDRYTRACADGDPDRVVMVVDKPGGPQEGVTIHDFRRADFLEIVFARGSTDDGYAFLRRTPAPGTFYAIVCLGGSYSIYTLPAPA
jgi:hypothetical protein